MADERIEVQRPIAADPASVFAVLSDPHGHVAIDSSGMLMDASGEPAKAVGDSFVVHMDRESLNDYPLGKYDVTVTITVFEQDREIAWTILGQIRPQIGHMYGYRLEPIGSLHLSPTDYSQQTPHVDPSVVAAIGVIGALIVIVAAINFITLMTARASRRAVEVGVRKALGAGRRDLVAQFMGETMLYVLTALVAAVAIAELALPALNAGLQRNMRFDYLGYPSLLAAILVTATAPEEWPTNTIARTRPLL